ncbi:MAG: GpE family phage tail protein [Acinetobacter sp.]
MGSDKFFAECKTKIPTSVDDVIADLAVTFYWMPVHVDHLDLDELMQWHERARIRTQAEQD